MHLRTLSLNDASNMLEWMHDANVIEHLSTDFASKELNDTREFIISSWYDTSNLNLAIAADNDEYTGTVSLKRIEASEAEFAIVVRTSAMGKGYAWYGMLSILSIAFDTLNLKKVYWCVSKSNHRAIRFYNRHAFNEEKYIPERILYYYSEIIDLKWYSVSCEEFNRLRRYSDYSVFLKE